MLWSYPLSRCYHPNRQAQAISGRKDFGENNHPIQPDKACATRTHRVQTTPNAPKRMQCPETSKGKAPKPLVAGRQAGKIIRANNPDRSNSQGEREDEPKERRQRQSTRHIKAPERQTATTEIQGKTERVSNGPQVKDGIGTRRTRKRNKPTKQHTPGRAQSNPPGSRGRKEAPTTDKEGPRESNKRAVYGTKDQNSRNLKTRIKRSSTPKAIETQETLTRRERATGGKKPPTGTSPTGTAKTRNLEGKRNKRGLRKKKRASHPVLEERANPEKRKQPREKT